MKSNESRQIFDFVDGFEWRFGQNGNVGLQVVINMVEDKMEVSPLYYRSLRFLSMIYYYNAWNYNPSIYVASLQRPTAKVSSRYHLIFLEFSFLKHPDLDQISPTTLKNLINQLFSSS